MCEETTDAKQEEHAIAQRRTWSLPAWSRLSQNSCATTPSSAAFDSSLLKNAARIPGAVVYLCHRAHTRSRHGTAHRHDHGHKHTISSPGSMLDVARCSMCHTANRNRRTIRQMSPCAARTPHRVSASHWVEEGERVRSHTPHAQRDRGCTRKFLSAFPRPSCHTISGAHHQTRHSAHATTTTNHW